MFVQRKMKIVWITSLRQKSMEARKENFFLCLFSFGKKKKFPERFPRFSFFRINWYILRKKTRRRREEKKTSDIELRQFNENSRVAVLPSPSRRSPLPHSWRYCKIGNYSHSLDFRSFERIFCCSADVFDCSTLHKQSCNFELIEWLSSLPCRRLRSSLEKDSIPPPQDHSFPTIKFFNLASTSLFILLLCALAVCMWKSHLTFPKFPALPLSSSMYVGKRENPIQSTARRVISTSQSSETNPSLDENSTRLFNFSEGEDWISTVSSEDVCENRDFLLLDRRRVISVTGWRREKCRRW